MQVRLLGPVDVVIDGEARAVNGLRRKAVLAVLALHRGEIVSVDRLIDVVWGGDAPTAPVNTLQSNVSYLRGVLGSKASILSRRPGYVLELGGDGTDVEVAERLIDLGERSSDPRARARHVQAALDLWRGPSLVDVARLTGLAEPAQRLDRLLRRARRLLIESRVALGEHTGVISDLERLAREDEFDEQVHRQLILALYGAGRQAEALAVYDRLRRKLADELGLDPSRALRDLELAVLRQDPALDAPASAGPPVDVRPVPAQLPANVHAFTGRTQELSDLDRLLTGAAPQAPAAVISAIAGTAGVGKTALAVRWAHHIRDRFPDGQLYADLRGYDPQLPMTAGDVLAGFLHALGMAAPEIPLEVDARAAAYRTLLDGRRILVVLDNAASVEQVRPLLPGTSSCLVVVTSRDSLAGLVARHGAHRLEVGLLPPQDAVALLAALIGSRVEAEPEAAAELAAQCAGLPLALRVAAELAAARPAVPLAKIVAELSDQHRRLDLLDAAGDAGTAVRRVFSWSYAHLPATAARAFRLVSLHPGADLDPYAAAALLDTDRDDAERSLDQLARAHLVQRVGAGRYGMHDLLRVYAAGLAAVADSPAKRHAATTRLLDHYLATAAAAMDQLHPAEAHRRPRIPPPATPVPPMTGLDVARAWLQAESGCLVAAAAHAAAHGWPEHAVRFSTTLFSYLDAGHSAEALAIHAHARDAAAQTDDSAGQALALNGLGAVHWRLGRYRQAGEVWGEALDLFRRSGDREGEARVLANLGIVEDRLGRYASAADHQRQALALFRSLGERMGEARVLTNLGEVEVRRGRYRPAADALQEAVALCRQAGDQYGEAGALTTLGECETRLRRHGPAAEHLRRALALFRQLDDRPGEAWALTTLGTVHRNLGEPGAAAEHHGRALALFDESGDRDGKAWALNGLGEAAQADARPTEALAQHALALTLATDTGIRDQQARAHTGLAHAHRTQRDPRRAREHYEQALALYRDLGVPDDDEILGHLDALARPLEAEVDASDAREATRPR
jgi:DNA-binding SARP family transcriptional activator/tetratricopeptide (TPR) repeat protein